MADKLGNWKFVNCHTGVLEDRMCGESFADMGKQHKYPTGMMVDDPYNSKTYEEWERNEELAKRQPAKNEGNY